MAANENLFSCLPTDPEEPHPWLLVTQTNSRRRKAFYSTSKKAYFERDIPEISGKEVSQTSYGWLLLIDQGRGRQLDCCLLNPASRQKIQLPPIEIKRFDWRSGFQCILSEPPTNPGCHVLLKSTSLRFCRLGDEKFIKRPMRFKDDYLGAAVNFKGKIYAWLNSSGRFVEVCFVGKELLLKELVNDRGQSCRIPWPSPINWPFAADFLVEYSCEELLLVHLIGYPYSCGEVAYFRIFKLKPSDREWEELTSIVDHALFVSHSGSMSLLCTDKSGCKRNSIYYELMDRNLYVYNIEDRSKTIIKPCPIKRGTGAEMSWIMM